MGVTSSIVLYLVIWSMIFFVALPIRTKTQGDLGEIVPGTHAGAPEHHFLKKKALWTTGLAFVVWAVTVWLILTDWITLADVEVWFDVSHWRVGGTGE